MALMSEFKEEREAILKNGTTKEKLAYIWDYYKWYIIVPTFVIIAIASYIVHLATQPDLLLQAIVLNTNNLEVADSVDSITNDFFKEYDIDPETHEISINTSMPYYAEDENLNYETSQVLMAWHSAKTLDFIGGDLTSLTALAYKGYFVNLTEVLSDEQISQYEPYFLYIDKKVYEEREIMLHDGGDISSMKLPDCTNPEAMDEPIPVMIDMSQSASFSELYGNISDTLVIGIDIASDNKDMVLKFIDYLMK